MFNAQDQKEVDVMAPSKRKEGCTFVSVDRMKDSSKADFQAIAFTFKDATGAVLTHKEFLPKKFAESTTDEEFKKNTQLNIARCYHIARAFLTEAQYLSIKVEGGENPPVSKYAELWLDITTQIGKLLKEQVLNNPAVEKTCALKVVLNKNKDKYYSGLPKVPPFISTVNHPKDFKVDPNYDIFEIPMAKPDQKSDLPEQGTAGTPGAFGGMSAGHKSEF